MPTITFNGANGTMCTVACENDASVRFSTDDNAITVVITSIRNAEAEAEGKVDADAGESESRPQECLCDKVPETWEFECRPQERRLCDEDADAEESERDPKACRLCDEDEDADESNRQEVDGPSVDFEQVLFEVTEQLGRCVAVLARSMRENKCVE